MELNCTLWGETTVGLPEPTGSPLPLVIDTVGSRVRNATFAPVPVVIVTVTGLVVEGWLRVTVTVVL